MRRLLLAASCLALAAPSLAAAQHTAGGGTPMGELMNLNQFATRGFMNQWSATRPAALSGFSRPARAWMKAQAKLQAESPRSPALIRADIDKVMGPEIKRMAKSRRVEADDITGAVLLKIMHDARLGLMLEARAVRKADGEAAAEPIEVKVAEANLNLREAAEYVSSESVALARD